MEQRTHAKVSPTLAGRVLELEPGRASVELLLTPEMAADERGLVHGSFPFGAADYAAMLAVNEPTVVLGSTSLKFLAPTVVGDRLRADARVTSSEGKKRIVAVSVRRGEKTVLEGELICFVPERHVLDGR